MGCIGSKEEHGYQGSDGDVEFTNPLDEEDHLGYVDPLSPGAMKGSEHNGVVGGDAEHAGVGDPFAIANYEASYLAEEENKKKAVQAIVRTGLGKAESFFDDRSLKTADPETAGMTETEKYFYEQANKDKEQVAKKAAKKAVKVRSKE
jgi:hypothetical protein